MKTNTLPTWVIDARNRVDNAMRVQGLDPVTLAPAAPRKTRTIDFPDIESHELMGFVIECVNDDVSEGLETLDHFEG